MTYLRIPRSTSCAQVLETELGLLEPSSGQVALEAQDTDPYFHPAAVSGDGAELLGGGGMEEEHFEGLHDDELKIIFQRLVPHPF